MKSNDWPSCKTENYIKIRSKNGWFVPYSSVVNLQGARDLYNVINVIVINVRNWA